MPPERNANPRAIQRVRHVTRHRLLGVLRVVDLSPNLRRVTLGGPDLDGFLSLAPDDHVKLFFFPAGTTPFKPVKGPDGPIWPTGVDRPPMRDFTPRRFDDKAQELDIEFVLHGEGPATQWAAGVRPGATLLIGGPRGSAVVPPRADGYLLVADESGLPAMARWLESMPAATPVTAIVEVADERHEIALHTAATLSLTWVHRNGREPGDAPLLLAALERLARPSGDFFAWAACESAQSRAIRRFLEGDYRLVADSLRTVGYWKRGIAGHHD
jgi:NADPH-dependent ferric siderophore reductase